MRHPRCIVLTATYATAKLKLLKEAVASMLAQEEQDWLWQLVLDGPDPEVDRYVMGELFHDGERGDPRIRVWCCSTTWQERRDRYRPAVIYNAHMERLTRWHPDAKFAWLSDDDLLKPKYLKAMADFMDGSKAPVVYCGYQVTEEKAGEYVHKCCIGSSTDYPQGGDKDPLGMLDSGCLMLTGHAFRELLRDRVPVVPEGWDAAAHCDGLFMRKLVAQHGIRGVGQTLFTKRQTKASAHGRPML